MAEQPHPAERAVSAIVAALVAALGVLNIAIATGPAHWFAAGFCAAVAFCVTIDEFVRRRGPGERP